MITGTEAGCGTQLSMYSLYSQWSLKSSSSGGSSPCHPYGSGVSLFFLVSKPLISPRTSSNIGKNFSKILSKTGYISLCSTGRKLLMYDLALTLPSGLVSKSIGSHWWVLEANVELTLFDLGTGAISRILPVVIKSIGGMASLSVTRV